MTLLMATASGEQHGLINTVGNSVQGEGNLAHMTPEMKAKCEKLRKEESRIVKARYINHRGMHERLSKPYMRWAGDKIQMWHLIPGHTYDLPVGFVNEVNNSGLKKRSMNDGDKTPVDKQEGVDRIHELVPVSF